MKTEETTMKNCGMKIMIAALIAVCFLLMPACGEDRFTDAGTLPPETNALLFETTDGSVLASVDPMTAASRGLQFSSNGDGTCTLTGIGTCTDMCLIIPDKSDSGDKVTIIASLAFAGNNTITAVQIPAGVTEIGAGAFADCTKLAYISVADGNSSFVDSGGILYSRNGSTLLCVPAGSAYVSLTLTKQVTKIADRATSGCTALKKVLYEGSSNDWKSVIIGEGNTALTSAEFTFITQTGK
jgi:hypothetical protein